ncbi:hypothetical protein RUND412_007480 [Rhizina undulata]
MLAGPLYDSASCRPSIGRRVTTKVNHLIAKFEALSIISQNPKPVASSPPPRRSIASLVSSGANSRKSSLRRLRDSIRKRANWFVEKSEKENKTDPPPPQTPPPKRILREPRSVDIRTRKDPQDALSSRPRRRVSVSARLQSKIRASEISESSGTAFDGPVSIMESGDFSRTSSASFSRSSTFTETTLSTPPVARILPSSFFAQLLPSAPPTPVKRITPPPKILFDPNEPELVLDEFETSGLAAAGLSNTPHRKKYRIRNHQWKWHMHANGGQHVSWRRKVTPPRISVRALVSKFRQVESGGDTTGGPSTESNPAVSQRSVLPEPQSFELQQQAQDLKYSSEAKQIRFRCKLNCSASGSEFSKSPPINFGTKANENGGVTLISPPSNNPNSSDTLGSSSNFSNINMRINPSVVGSKGSTDKFYTAHTKTEPPPQSSKKYRKTPPPQRFFGNKRQANNDSAYNTDNSNTSSGSKESEETELLESENSAGDSVIVSVAVPLVPIFTPTPISVAKSMAIRDLVRRFI